MPRGVVLRVKVVGADFYDGGMARLFLYTPER